MRKLLNGMKYVPKRLWLLYFVAVFDIVKGVPDQALPFCSLLWITIRLLALYDASAIPPLKIFYADNFFAYIPGHCIMIVSEVF